MSVSNPEVIVDQVSDLSSAKESVLFFELSVPSIVGIRDHFAQDRCNPRVRNSKSGNEFSREWNTKIPDRPLNQPSPLL